MKHFKNLICKNIFTYLSLIILTQGALMSATLENLEYKKNNIPVIFEKHKTLPIFNMQLIFKNSGYINDLKYPGITNLTAKMLNEGTKIDGAIEYARKLENDAISIYTATGLETFVIEVSCLKQEIPTALRYLKELLDDPNISKNTLEKVKKLQISKLKQKENDFDYVASSNLKKLTYKGSALANTSSGDIKSLKTIDLNDIKSNLNNILNIDNLIIVVGGDIKIEDIKTSIKPILTTLKKNGTKTLNRIKPIQNQDELVVKKETQQAYIYFTSPFDIQYNSKQNHIAKVASFILGGGGFGSRMMEEIRVKHGLAYSTYGHISNKKSYSHFTGYLQTKLENRKKAQDMVNQIVKEFVKNGVTQQELEAAKNFLSGSEPLRTETFSQRLNRAFMLYYKGLPFDYPKKELQMIENLTLEELNNFIKSHKEIERLSFSIVTK